MSVVLVALVLTLADAAKPLVVDDTAYTYYAEQIQRDPTDPYGFEILWYGDPQPAVSILAPPVLPYWLAGANALFGDDPAAWKLSLFPFALALAASLRSLLARFAPGLDTPLLWMAVLSPSVLPFMNLMLDIPALSLGLLAVVIFLAACDRERADLAALAGLVAGLAMQTKYTAATAPAAMLAWGAIARRPRHALLASGVALAVFVGWEALLVLRYGGSQLLLHAEHVLPQSLGASPRSALLWTTGLVTMLGALAPAVGLLALVALGRSRRAIGAAASCCALCFAAIPFLPAAELAEVDRPGPWPRTDDVPAEQWLFGLLGLGVVASVGALVFRCLRRTSTREDRFLAAWLAIEVAAFVALSPFLAARRVLGIALVSLLLSGRGAAHAIAAGASRDGLRLAVGTGVTLGLLFTASDLADALAGRDAVQRTEEALRTLGADRSRETVWFTGHWGFRFYAERAGMRPVVPGRPERRTGDWLVVPEGVARQEVRAPLASPALARIEVRGIFPWSTLPWAYLGPTPIRPRPVLQMRVSIHRMLKRPPPAEPGPAGSR